MARKHSVWKNTKVNKKRKYSGHYKWDRTGRRFVLVAKLANGSKDFKSYESHNVAKREGFKKVR